MSEQRLGEDNPAWKSIEECESNICIGCGNLFYYKRNGIKVGQIRKFCSEECQKGLDLKEIDSSDQVYKTKQI